MTDDYERNPLLRRIQHKGKQPKSYWQSAGREKSLADRVGGRTTLASGAKNEKGDVRKVGVVRIEHKTTQRKSYSLKLSDMEIVMNHALGNDEIPAMVIEFIDPNTGKTLQSIAAIPLKEFERLVKERETT